MRRDFEKALRSAISQCYAIGYQPTILEGMINTSNPVDVAKKLVLSGEFQHGIRELTKLGRQDLTIEAIMQETRFSSLFTIDEISAASWRLNNVNAA